MQNLSFDYAYQNNEDFTDGGSVQSGDSNQEVWLRQHQTHSVFCGKDAVKVVFPSASLSEVKVLGMYAVLLLCLFGWVFFLYLSFLYFRVFILCLSNFFARIIHF